MIYRRRIFTLSEISRARARRHDGAPWRTLAFEFNCDYGTIRRVIEPEYAHRRARQIREAKEARGETDNAVNHIADARPEVPERVLLDRDKRSTAPRTITAMLCGDPAPGQSALDKLQALV